MFLFLVLAGSIAAFSSASSVVPALQPPYVLENARNYFERFMQIHHKSYMSQYERIKRFRIFRDNLERIIRMNLQFEFSAFAINQFMDLDPFEFTNSYTGFIKPDIKQEMCQVLTDEDIPYIYAPESFDWRDVGYVVTPVRDQKACNSCYAFSAVGNIEGQYARKYKQVTLLSPQQIVDCDPRNNGCGGGFMSVAFRSLIETGRTVAEQDYPYVGVELDYCYRDLHRSMVRVTGCRSYVLRSQEKLKQLLFLTGPLSIENGIPYWIVKNSWGKAWGEHGYLRIIRGEGFSSCGILEGEVSSAIIE